MLTITETIDAIRAINTEPEILTGACKRILGLDAASKVDMNVQTVAFELIEVSNKLPLGEGLRALCAALAIDAVTSAKKGHEAEVLHLILDDVTHWFIRSTGAIFAQKLVQDPQGAAEDLQALLQRIKIK